MDKFDIPKEFIEVIRVASSNRIIDLASLVSMVQEHGDNLDAIVDEVVDAAYANRHVNVDSHKAVAVAADNYYRAGFGSPRFFKET